MGQALISQKVRMVQALSKITVATGRNLTLLAATARLYRMQMACGSPVATVCIIQPMV